VNVHQVELDKVVAEDLGRLVTFDNTLWAEEEPGEPLIADQVVAWMNRRRPNTKRWAWIVNGADGGIAGLAVLRGSTTDNLHLGILHVRVVPQARRGGVGRALLGAAARRAQDDSRRLLSGYTLDSVSSGESFVVAMGATPGLHVRRSELDLSGLDRDFLPAWLDVPARTSRRYELATVIGPYPQDQYESIAEIEQVMNTAPHDDLDVEDEVRDAAWVAAREAHYDPAIEKRWTIFAKERSTDRLVAFTQVFFYDDWPGMVNQGNTGVHPDHRGYGLGLWMKAAMLQRILDKAPESRRMRTTNAYSNAPMLAINDELGYRVAATQTAWQADTAEVLQRVGG